MHWLKRLEIGAVRWVCGLPPAVLVRLSGKPAVVLDGLTLNAEMQFLLSTRERLYGAAAATIREATPDLARKKVRRETDKYPDPPIHLGAVRDLVLKADSGPLPARHYTPKDLGGPHPLVVFFHGGGYTLGDLETHDGFCRQLCHHAAIHVLSVAYRLAPEHPFPAAFDDARAAFLWAAVHATELGADPARVGVGGDSAGGNLSASVALDLSRAGGPSVPAFQLLIYPTLEAGSDSPSRSLFARGFFLTTEDMTWFEENYTSNRRELHRDPRVSPLLGPDLSGLPPAYVITAGFDPVRDEGEAYVAALRAAGSPVTFHRFDELIHGFINLSSVSPAARAAVQDIARETRQLARGTAVR
jgi:acetyl esterase